MTYICLLQEKEEKAKEEERKKQKLEEAKRQAAKAKAAKTVKRSKRSSKDKAPAEAAGAPAAAAAAAGTVEGAGSSAAAAAGPSGEVAATPPAEGGTGEVEVCSSASKAAELAAGGAAAQSEAAEPSGGAVLAAAAEPAAGAEPSGQAVPQPAQPRPRDLPALDVSAAAAAEGDTREPESGEATPPGLLAAVMKLASPAFSLKGVANFFGSALPSPQPTPPVLSPSSTSGSPDRAAAGASQERGQAGSPPCVMPMPAINLTRSMDLAVEAAARALQQELRTPVRMQPLEEEQEQEDPNLVRAEESVASSGCGSCCDTPGVSSALSC